MRDAIEPYSTNVFLVSKESADQVDVDSLVLDEPLVECKSLLSVLTVDGQEMVVFLLRLEVTESQVVVELETSTIQYLELAKTVLGGREVTTGIDLFRDRERSTALLSNSWKVSRVRSLSLGSRRTVFEASLTKL